MGGERYFEIPDIEKLTNADKYPLFVIMTCDFTRFDDPSQKSGGEFLYLREKSGAIGIFATTRKIGISNAQEVTKVGAKWLFDYDNTLPNLTMAEALMNTKNENVSEIGYDCFYWRSCFKTGNAKTKYCYYTR